MKPQTPASEWVQKYEHSLPREHRDTPWQEEYTARQDIVQSFINWLMVAGAAVAVLCMIALWMVAV